MIDYEKIAKIMCWQIAEGMTAEDHFKYLGLRPEDVPNTRIVDIVEAGGLASWAEKHSKANSYQELLGEIMHIMRIAINEPIFADKVRREQFLPLYNFHIYSLKLDRNGKLMEEAERITERCWYGTLQQKKLKEKTDAFFSKKPDPQKYETVKKRIQEVWGFSDYEMEAFRYFVAMCREPDLNPSLNKSIYLYSKFKQTGKTSVARAIIAVLNGESNLMDASKHESSLRREMQYGAHDLPLATQSNAVLLDDSLFYDTKKTYGQIKAKLTSAYCDYNPKFLRTIKLKARRNYFFTSNDPLNSFVQDDKERRFISISLHNKPEQISFTEIYDLWKEFCVNVTPEKDFQAWYNSFEPEDGMERKDVNYFKDEILSSTYLLRMIREHQNYSLTLKFFVDILITGKPTREEKDNLKLALTEIIGDTDNGGFRWSRRRTIDTLEEKIEEMNRAEAAVEALEEAAKKETEESKEDDLPF